MTDQFDPLRAPALILLADPGEESADRLVGLRPILSRRLPSARHSQDGPLPGRPDEPPR